jgi:hypothetical protein
MFLPVERPARGIGEPKSPDAGQEEEEAFNAVVGQPRSAIPAEGPNSTDPERPRLVGRGPASTTTEEVGVGYCGISVQAKRVVFVIDRSLSMGLSGAFGRARAELRASLDRLPRDTQFQVILYNRRAEPLRVDGTAGMLPAEPEWTRKVIAAVDALRAEGGTDHKQALFEGMLLKPEVIYWVTDGDDLTAQAVAEVTKRNKGQCAIQVVDAHARGPEPEPNLLRRLADANGGAYRALNPEKK